MNDDNDDEIQICVQHPAREMTRDITKSYAAFMKALLWPPTKKILRVCFLDEPTSNLDEKGVSWYIENVKAAINDKLVIISSNQVHEYDFCDHVLNIPDFQQTK